MASTRRMTVADLDNSIRAVLDVELTRATSEARVAVEDHGLALDDPGSLESNLPAIASTMVERPVPNPDQCRERRREILERLTRPDEVVIEPANEVTTWVRANKEVEAALESISEKPDMAKLKERLHAFFASKMSSIALTKYRLLVRWNTFSTNAECIERLGNTLTDTMVNLANEYYDCRRRRDRLRHSDVVMPDDVDELVRDCNDRDAHVAHARRFLLRLKWMVYGAGQQIVDTIRERLTDANGRETSAPMIVVTDDKALSAELGDLFARLATGTPPDLSNAHRLLSAARAISQNVTKRVADERRTIEYDAEAGSGNASLLRVKHATWIPDLRQTFATMMMPLPGEIARKARLVGLGATDQLLLSAAMAVDQQDDLDADQRCLQTAKAYVDRIELQRNQSESESHAAATTSPDDTSPATTATTFAARDETPVVQKFAAMHLLRAALTRRVELQLLRRLNVLRAIQRRITIDAIGGFAREDRMQLHYRAKGAPSTTPGTLVQPFPRDFIIDEDTFMQYEGLETRDDTFEAIVDDGATVTDTAGADLRVRDADGIPIIYDAALDDLRDIKRDLLLIGTSFLGRADVAGADQACETDRPPRSDEGDGIEVTPEGEPVDDDDAHNGEQKKKQDVVTSAQSSAQCDRAKLLLDLMSSEMEFQSAKVDLAMALLEVYEHVVDRDALGAIAGRIIALMERRPCVDLDAAYFAKHYARDTTALRVQAQLIREILEMHMDAEAPSTSDDYGAGRVYLLPHSVRPVALLDLCKRTLWIVDLLDCIEARCDNVHDVWRRLNSRLPTSVAEVQHVSIAILEHALHLWRLHRLETHHGPLPSLEFDPRFLARTEALPSAPTMALSNSSQDPIRAKLQFLRLVDARMILIDAVVESDICASIITGQSARTVVTGQAEPDLVGVSGFIAQSVGFPVDALVDDCFSSNNASPDTVETSIRAFAGMAALQRIFLAALGLVVKHHDTLTTVRATSSTSLLAQNSVLSLAGLSADVLGRLRRQLSDDAHLPRLRSRLDAAADRLLQSVVQLSRQLLPSLRTPVLIGDLMLACDQLAAHVDSTLSPASTPFSRGPTAERHRVWNLCRGIDLLNEFTSGGGVLDSVTADDVEQEALAVRGLIRLAGAISSVECLSKESAPMITPKSQVTPNARWRDARTTRHLRIALNDVNNDLIMDEEGALHMANARRSANVIAEHVALVLYQLRLLRRCRADSPLQPPDSSMFHHVDADDAEGMCVALHSLDQDVREEIDVHYRRIQHRIAGLGSLAKRVAFLSEVHVTLRLHDYVCTLRRYSPDLLRPWTAVKAKAAPVQELATLATEELGPLSALQERRPGALADLGDGTGGPTAPDAVLKTEFAALSKRAGDASLIGTSPALFLTFQDPDDLDRIRVVLQSALQREMHALDVIEARMHTRALASPSDNAKAAASAMPPARLEFIRQFVEDLKSVAIPSGLQSGDGKEHVATKDGRLRAKIVLAVNDVQTALARLAGAVLRGDEGAAHETHETWAAARKTMLHRLRLVESENRRLERALKDERDNAEWKISRGVIDAHFSAILELEQLRHRERRVRERIAEMASQVREQVQTEFQNEIRSLKAQLVLVESKFRLYKSDLKKQVASGIGDVRRQALLGVVDSKRVPFQTKRATLEVVRAFTEEAASKAERVEMQRAMLRMKTLFEMKEVTLQARIDAQIKKSNEKAVEARELFEALEQARAREKILLKQLVDEKNALKLTRDSMTTIKQDLEACQRDRRKLLAWKAKNERHVTDLENDVQKFSDLKDVDVTALINRVRRAERALQRMTTDRNATEGTPGSQAYLTKKLKLCESALIAERRAKGDAIAEVLSMRERIAQLEEASAGQEAELTATAEDLRRQRGLNAELIEEMSGMRAEQATLMDKCARLRNLEWFDTELSKHGEPGDTTSLAQTPGMSTRAASCQKPRARIGLDQVALTPWRPTSASKGSLSERPRSSMTSASSYTRRSARVPGLKITATPTVLQDRPPSTAKLATRTTSPPLPHRSGR